MLEAMFDVLPVLPGIALPRQELTWRFSRSGGPGGQSVNTADSRVELLWNLAESSALSRIQRDRAMERLAGRLVNGVLVITASEHRSQLQNRRAAEARLVALVIEGIAPPAAPRRPTRPSRGAVRARLDSKRRRGALKQQRRTSGDD
jgi:ribosome-associated protein